MQNTSLEPMKSYSMKQKKKSKQYSKTFIVIYAYGLTLEKLEINHVFNILNVIVTKKINNGCTGFIRENNFHK